MTMGQAGISGSHDLVAGGGGGRSVNAVAEALGSARPHLSALRNRLLHDRVDDRRYRLSSWLLPFACSSPSCQPTKTTRRMFYCTANRKSVSDVPTPPCGGEERLRVHGMDDDAPLGAMPGSRLRTRLQSHKRGSRGSGGVIQFSGRRLAWHGFI